MNKQYFLILLSVVLLLGACRTSKSSIGSSKLKKMPAEELLAELDSNQIDFEWFSGRAKMKYNDGNKVQSFTANIRIRKDSLIWVQITSLMGIEAARLKITPDTVYMLDRLKKRYLVYPVDSLQQYVPFKLSMGLLQDIIVGNWLWQTDGRMKSKIDNGNYLLTIESTDFANTYRINPDDFAILNWLLVDKGYNRQLSMVGHDFEEQNNKPFGMERELEFTDRKLHATVEMKFTKVRWNEVLSFPFYVSDKYE